MTNLERIREAKKLLRSMDARQYTAKETAMIQCAENALIALEYELE